MSGIAPRLQPALSVENVAAHLHTILRESMARILIVNDDPSARPLLHELLEGTEQDIVTCHAGHATFAELEREPPDLVILDVASRELTVAWDMLTYLQLHPDLCCIPVIVCAGRSDDLLAKEEWLAEHKINVLPKPFEIEELLGQVEVGLKR